MSDDNNLSPVQSLIKEKATRTLRSVNKVQLDAFVSPASVCSAIIRLGRNSSPGFDGVRTEHLVFGMSETVIHKCTNLFSTILSLGIVPNSFSLGVIVPILKKPTLNPNSPDNYRPITLSSTLSKVLEVIMMPADTVSKIQFGFCSGRGTSFACNLLSDVTQYFHNSGSPVFVRSLDAEKCFDRIWHDGLFYKLLKFLPLVHWRFLYTV